MASPMARPRPMPAATPSVVARFRNSPVSRAMPKRPRSRPGPTSSDVRPPHASSKSCTRQAPFMATAASAPALDQIDDQRPEPHLDADARPCRGRRACPRRDGARDAGGRVAQIASREDVGQPVEPRAHAEPAAYRLAQRGRRHLAGSPPERHRMDAARVDRRWGGPAALHAGTACAVAPYGGLPAA